MQNDLFVKEDETWIQQSVKKKIVSLLWKLRYVMLEMMATIPVNKPKKKIEK